MKIVCCYFSQVWHLSGTWSSRGHATCELLPKERISFHASDQWERTYKFPRWGSFLKCIHSLPQRYHRKCFWLAYPFYIFSQIFMKLKTCIASQGNPKIGCFWSLALVLCHVNIYLEYKGHVHSHSTVPSKQQAFTTSFVLEQKSAFHFLYLYVHVSLFQSVFVHAKFVWFNCLIGASMCPHIFESDRPYCFVCEIPDLCCTK